ncbi:MAG: hypothetical protein R2818_15975, partial [Flavobacteriales bacterium]
MFERHSTHTTPHFLFKVGALLLLLFANIPAFAQQPAAGRGALAWADSVYRAQANEVISNASMTLPVLDSALKVYVVAQDTCKAALINSWRSHCFEATGRTDSAVAVALRALRMFRPDCDSLVLMSIHVNLSNAWLELGEYRKVKELTEASLRNWNERWPYSIAHNGLYTNRAIALANLNDKAGALQAFRDVLANARKEGIVSNESDALQNLGAIFGWMAEEGSTQANLDSSERYQRRAIDLARRIGDTRGLLYLYSNMG